MIEAQPVKYTGRTRNLQLGNEIAQRSLDFIRSRWPREKHERLLLAEARRLSEGHWKVAVTPRRDFLGNWFVDTDYAESLKQAAANLVFMALRERETRARALANVNDPLGEFSS